MALVSVIHDSSGLRVWFLATPASRTRSKLRVVRLWLGKKIASPYQVRARGRLVIDCRFICDAYLVHGHWQSCMLTRSVQ